MENAALYPLKFDPIYQYRTWGGRRLGKLLKKRLPPGDPIGEAWILSDRDDHASKIANGPLAGKTIGELLKNFPQQMLGKLAGKFDRFPLLLKFLDCKELLSVQVHPSDLQKKYIPPGETGKTEAWVVLDAGKKGIIYAGLKPGTTGQKIRDDLDEKNLADALSHFKPETGDCVLIESGTVHTLGDVVVFELQENSDVTYRLYDWDRPDKKTGKPRQLQVDKAFACINFDKTGIGPVTPVVNHGPGLRELLITDDHFKIWRLTGDKPIIAGKEGVARVLVNIDGRGQIDYKNKHIKFKKGEVVLLPASVGACCFSPDGRASLLEIALPE